MSWFCDICDKELSEDKGELAHGCLDCHGQPYSDKLFFARKEIKNLQAKNQALQRKLDLAVEALNFYADKKNWEERVKNGTVICAFNDRDVDDRETFFDKTFCGKRARQALKEIKEME